jgi:hypothetical protein
MGSDRPPLFGFLRHWVIPKWTIADANLQMNLDCTTCNVPGPKIPLGCEAPTIATDGSHHCPDPRRR